MFTCFPTQQNLVNRKHAIHSIYSIRARRDLELFANRGGGRVAPYLRPAPCRAQFLAAWACALTTHEWYKGVSARDSAVHGCYGCFALL